VRSLLKGYTQRAPIAQPTQELRRGCTVREAVSATGVAANPNRPAGGRRCRRFVPAEATSLLTPDEKNRSTCCIIEYPRSGAKRLAARRLQ
jgi:hypothetical protein